MAQPAALADLLQALDIGVLHELAADVGLGDEGKVALQLGLGNAQGTS